MCSLLSFRAEGAAACCAHSLKGGYGGFGGWRGGGLGKVMLTPVVLSNAVYWAHEARQRSETFKNSMLAVWVVMGSLPVAAVFL